MRRTEQSLVLIGAKYGRLLVVAETGRSKDGRKQYLCKCDCGNETTVIGRNLKNGNTKSCGCLKQELSVVLNTTHGRSKTRLYRVWASMKDRCYRETCHHYPSYGGRGIIVCDEWLEFEPFFEWAMANGYKAGLTIERKDVNGSYCPENCCWITAKEQGFNKRTTIRLTLNGETHFVHEWSEILGINKDTIYTRKQAGLSDEDCLHVGRLPRRNLKRAGEKL